MAVAEWSVLEARRAPWASVGSERVVGGSYVFPCGVWKIFRGALELDGRDWCGKVSWASKMAGPAGAWWHELCCVAFLRC